MATAADQIANISVGRFDNITAQWGGYSNTTTGAPDWGRILWETVSVYPDFMGIVAWFILFSIPFIMMWLAHADMTPAAILGLFFGLYIFIFIPEIWQNQAIFMMVIGICGILYSMYQKRG
jgi:hypothetical protein